MQAANRQSTVTIDSDSSGDCQIQAGAAAGSAFQIDASPEAPHARPGTFTVPLQPAGEQSYLSSAAATSPNFPPVQII